jgi:hypothetical protein
MIGVAMQMQQKITAMLSQMTSFVGGIGKAGTVSGGFSDEVERLSLAREGGVLTSSESGISRAQNMIARVVKASRQPENVIK